mmetsp:Transcript_145818/g.252502  ORF Transcript_145818/g.252502 Transcript_145818/m.252502 type:complete len:729 (-) Transcript_145818:63-2249(-)
MALRPWSAFLVLQPLLSAAAEGDVCPTTARLMEPVSAPSPTAAPSHAGHLPSPSRNLIQVRSLTAEADTAPASEETWRDETWPDLEGCEMRLIGNKTKKVLPDFAISSSSSNAVDESATGPAVSWGPNQSRMDCYRSCWLAKENDMDQWIQWDFGYAKDIRRVWTRGRHFPGQLGDENWIKAYTLEYKDNRTSDKWKKIDGTFQANIDRDSVAENTLETPVEATSLKLRPTEWNGRIALRAEIIGCALETPTVPPTAPPKVPLDIFEMPLVGEDDTPDYGITASSEYGLSFGPEKSRLRSSTCWIPKPSTESTNSSEAWIQWDLGAPRIVTRLQTKGCGFPGNGSNISTSVGPYYLLYKDARKCDEWMAIQEKFKGQDSGAMKEHIFKPPLIATHIKIWYLAEELSGLRAEIIGHAMPLPVAVQETVSVVCKNCLCEPVEDVEREVADKCSSCAFGINGAFPCNVTGICRCAASRPVVIPKPETYVPEAKMKVSTKNLYWPKLIPVSNKQLGKLLGESPETAAKNTSREVLFPEPVRADDSIWELPEAVTAVSSGAPKKKKNPGQWLCSPWPTPPNIMRNSIKRCVDGNKLDNGYEYRYNYKATLTTPGVCGVAGCECCLRPKITEEVPPETKYILKHNFHALMKEDSDPKVEIEPMNMSNFTEMGDFVPVSPGESVPMEGPFIVPMGGDCRAAAGADVADDDCSSCTLPDYAESWPCNETTLCDCAS